MQTYFVSFRHSDGIDSCDISRQNPIVGMDDILEIQHCIQKEHGFTNVRVFVWKKFEKAE